MTELSIHELSLGFSHDRQMLVEFLAKHHLNYEDDIEAAFGVFDSDDNLTGCGCCAGNLLKCFAVDESLRGQNALGSLVSRLVENRFEAGHYDLFVITRPKNKVLFLQLYRDDRCFNPPHPRTGCCTGRRRSRRPRSAGRGCPAPQCRRPASQG